jgi:hypothetical protein
MSVDFETENLSFGAAMSADPCIAKKSEILRRITPIILFATKNSIISFALGTGSF